LRLESITQGLGDDPISNMFRQIMALFDEGERKAPNHARRHTFKR
jgi:hypothetical protein